MKNTKSHLRFNRQERSGIFILLCLVLAVQLLFYLSRNWEIVSGEPKFLPDSETQAQIDSLLAQEANKDFQNIRPFNPNFITDYKGYVLGLTPDEIDRLHRYREEGKFVRDAAEFQEVTGVGDSLLNLISVWFKFPEWRLGKTENPNIHVALQKKDLNSVESSELMRIRGIGEVLSARIVKFRKALGGFIEDDQLRDVYGLDHQLVQRILEKYTVIQKPKVVLLNLNTATKDELASLVYISSNTARNIIRYRDSVGVIERLEELQKIQGFPTDKISRIKLYLTL